jgi:polyphenol oxidase
MLDKTRPEPLRSPLLDGARAHGVRHGFFTRAGGVSEGIFLGLNVGLGSGDSAEAVHENRRRVAAWMGVAPDRLVTVHQCHSPDVVVVEAPFTGARPSADALVTRQPGLALGVLAADCGPVLFADAEAQVVGAAHAGWKGAVAGIIPKTVEKMGRLATARPDRMLAYISPCISQQYFEVGGEVSALFPDWFVDSESFAKDHVDLKGFVIQQLLDTGVPGSQIHADPECTYRETHVYYSYRREKEKAGRMLALIQLT